MNQDDLLERLKSEIAPDLVPVQPLSAATVRALGLLATWVLLAGAVVMLLGPRLDVAALGPWWAIGLSATQVGFCFVLFVIGLRLSIPGMGGGLAAAPVWVAGAMLVHLGVSAVTLERSALAPEPGSEWRVGLVCASAIALLSLAPLALAAVMLRRGLLTRPFPAFLVTGVASGLVAEAAWRLHCPYSNWGHVASFHSGALIFPLTVALAAAAVVARHPTEPRGG